MSDIDHARSAVSDFMMAHDTMSRGSLCPPGIYANDQLVPSYCPSREDPQAQVNTGIDSIEAQGYRLLTPVLYAQYHTDMARRTSKLQSKRSRKQRIADRRRQDELDDLEAGPTLEQIADETGTLLSILIQLNSPSIHEASNASTQTLARAQSSSLTHKQHLPPLRRSPRNTTHYIHPGYVCKCSHTKRSLEPPKYIELPPSTPAVEQYIAAPAPASPYSPPPSPRPSLASPQQTEPPLFVAEDELLDVTYPHASVSLRWAPYPAPHSSAGELTDAASCAAGVIRRSARYTKHYVPSGYVCECLHMRRIR